MNEVEVLRDERTVTVENASYRWAYMVLSFGTLLIVAYRSFVFRESPWDLLALVIVGGFVCTVYQGWQKTLTRHSVKVAALGALAAGIVAAILAASLVALR